MKKLTLVGLMTAALVLMFSSSAMAQGGEAPNNALKSGQSALSFGTPGGGNPHVSQRATGEIDEDELFTSLFGNVSPMLGYHYMLADNMRLGVNLGLTVDSLSPRADGADDSTAIGFDFAPQFNYYTSTRGTVAPYFFGILHFSTFSDGRDETTGDFDEAEDDAEMTFEASEQSTLDLAAGVGVEWFPVTRFSISGQVGLNLALMQRDSEAFERGFGMNLFTSALAANIYF